MVIQLEQVKPDYLESEKIATSGTWDKSVLIKSGEKIQIVAPSGSGKTSFIHFLYGLRRDYKGRILIDGKDLKAYTAEDFSALRSAKASIIFQDLRLFPEHTVFENINIKRSLDPFHGQEKIIEMVRHLGIENKLQKKIKTCSYGEQQRVAIIRALQQPFEMLLMDEPFSNLDEANRIKAMELIGSECSKRNATMILADLKQLDFFPADRIIYL